METEPLTITVDPASELGRALEDRLRPVVLIRGDERFTVLRQPIVSDLHRKAERFREALHDIAALITPEEAEFWKERLYRSRDEGSRPITRP